MFRGTDSRMGTSARASRHRPRRASTGAKLFVVAALTAAGIAANFKRLAAFDGRCRRQPLEGVCGSPPVTSSSRRPAGFAHKSDSQNARGLRGSPRPTLEYQVKAAFLLSFVTFTEWPSTAFESASSPVRICVLGDDPFEGSLMRTVEGEAVAGHPLTVTAVTHEQDVSQCHLLFVPQSTDGRGGALNREAADSPVLIVVESDALWHHGAIIRFAIDQGRVRFDVDRTAAERSGLRLSSKLLRIARLVR
jgi:hypothetical protein